ncbi:polysaccharide biosynthesis tyrosine autokinase [Agrococcus citreus]|uniref:Polysaccharide biosynthesis tyrosine autokinase n=1 Tax=Agrococcus citreus TaxID=84643 RepID=A0ABN1YTI8_9MICO
MELRDYVRILRKNWLLLAALMLVGIGGGATWSLLQSPLYRAQTQVFVSTQGSETSAELVQGNSFTLSRVNTYARLATSQVVLERVAASGEFDVSVEQLDRTVSATPILDTTIISISVQHGSPEQAAGIADAVAFGLAATVESIESSEGSPSPVRLEVVERATPASSPISPQPLVAVGLSVLAALVAAVLLSFGREALDTRIRTERDLRKVTAVPIVGSISFDPKAKQRPLLVHAEPLSPKTENFRTLRTNLQFVEIDDSKRVFAVTSSIPGEGKSTTAVNLALALADAGETVVLIDADLRKPRIAEYLGIDGAVGLTDVLIGRANLVDAVQLWGDSSLYALPSGKIPPNPSELLGSQAMRNLIDQLAKEFDWVLFDCPPLLPVTDGALLAKHTAGAILVVASGRTTQHQVEDALRTLETVDAPIAGIAMTMMPVSSSSYGYGYGSAYSMESERKSRGFRLRRG